MPTLADIAALLKVEAPAPAADLPIRGLANLDEAETGDLSFLGSDRYLKDYLTTRASAVIVQKSVNIPQPPRVPHLLVPDADLAMAQVLGLFAPPVPAPPRGIDPSARIDPSASLADDVAIGPFVVVGPRSTVGHRTILHPGVFIGSDVLIGDDCHIYPNVVIRERITLGHRVIINSGSVLGTDGFGYRWDGSRHAKIPQIGTIVIEDDVELGSCVCIDRAKFSATRIGRGTKIDNLVQIAHNVQIGPHCIIVGQTGLAGSSRVGAGVVLGGQTAVRDHIHIGDRAMAAARSAIIEDVEPGTTVSGMPALPHRQSLREQAAIRRLPDLVVQVRKLQEEIAALKKA